MKNLIVGLLIGSALTGLAAKAIDVQLQFDVRDLYVAALLGDFNSMGGGRTVDDKIIAISDIADKLMVKRKHR